MTGSEPIEQRYRIEPATRVFIAPARALLRGLPEWFGRPDALEGYASATGRLPTFVAFGADGVVAGFASIAGHSPVAAELSVIAVARARHRRGCGRQLLAHVEAVLREQGVRWLTVKTLAASDPDPHYAATRRFYENAGFEPLEIFPDLWGKGTPYLQMMKAL